ncbi:MAG TPA: hypothetical protein GXX47_07590, partial [Firmicutes bacterium]|nr:hypothetical protein [Bacillota bacterium]
ARAAVEGRLDVSDADAVAKVFAEAAGLESVQIRRLSDNGNFYLFTLPSVIFGETEI